MEILRTCMFYFGSGEAEALQTEEELRSVFMSNNSSRCRNIFPLQHSDVRPIRTLSSRLGSRYQWLKTDKSWIRGEQHELDLTFLFSLLKVLDFGVHVWNLCRDWNQRLTFLDPPVKDWNAVYQSSSETEAVKVRMTVFQPLVVSAGVEEHRRINHIN